MNLRSLNESDSADVRSRAARIFVNHADFQSENEHSWDQGSFAGIWAGIKIPVRVVAKWSANPAIFINENDENLKNNKKSTKNRKLWRNVEGS